MVRYRRAQCPGGTFAFTFTLKDRGSDLLVRHFDRFKAAYLRVHQRWPFETIAAVVLPDHVHVVWKLPEEDGDYSVRIRLIKTLFTKGLANTGIHFKSLSKAERACWQRRFWEHQIRDDTDLQHQIDYIHINPVKHGLVKHVKDWPYSTFHRYVRKGMLPIDWASDSRVGGA
jgi:putative transposase